MAQPKLKALTFPGAGISRATAYQSQPPYTTPSAENVRIHATYERRARGGSRPGFTAALTAHADCDGPVRYLGSVPWVNSGARQEALVAIEGREFFYIVTGSTFLRTSTINAGAGTDVFPAGSGQLFATQKQQKLYVANPDGSGYSADDGWTVDVLVWDPSSPADVDYLDITTGTPPENCPLICTYRDRIVLAGPNHVWYMSRICTPGDWNFACDLDDPGRAVAGASSDAGMIGEPITALIPYSDEFLVFGCVNSIWVLKGDPAYGGRIDAVSYDIGVLSGASWCRTPDDSIVFLSRDGLYLLKAGATGKPESLSRYRVPDDLLSLDPVSNRISMGYNLIQEGIHISVTPASGQGEHWFMHWPEGALYKDSYPVLSQPTAFCQFALDQTEEKSLLWGGMEGFVFKHSQTLATDHNGDKDTVATVPMASHVILGPVMIGAGDYYNGMLTEIIAILAEDSGLVDWEVFVGDTAEDAYKAAGAFASGSWGPGRNYTERPRARAAAAIIKISSQNRWAMEHILLRASMYGLERVD